MEEKRLIGKKRGHSTFVDAWLERMPAIAYTVGKHHLAEADRGATEPRIVPPPERTPAIGEENVECPLFLISPVGSVLKNGQ